MMIRMRLAKLIKERLPVIDEFSLVKYNGRETLIQEVISDCLAMPLGYDRKMVVLEECYFLAPSPTREKIDKDQDYQALIDYIDHPNDASDLVMTLSEPSFNAKTDLGKRLKDTAMIYELTDIDDKSWPEYVKRYFAKENVPIDGSAIDELVSRCQGDATLFVSEAQKLISYGGRITRDVVKLLVTRPLEDNAFELSNALTRNQSDKALAIFRDLKTFSEEPIMLISLLARQFRLMLKVRHLVNTGLRQPEIAKTLKIHEYRVKLALQSEGRLPEERLRDILERLYQLDFDIKSGQVDRFYGFEMFLINFNE